MAQLLTSRQTDELCLLFDDYRNLRSAAKRPVPLALGAERFAVDHVRRAIAALKAHYTERLARAESEDAEAALRRLDRFAASLPAPRSGLWTLAPLAAIAVVAQILSPIGASFGPITQRVNDITSISTLDPTKLSEATKSLMDSSLAAVLYVAWVFAVATVIVEWWHRRAFRALLVLIGVETARRGRPLPPVRAASADGDGHPRTIRERERAVFRAAGADLPAVGSFDLVIDLFAAAALALMGLIVLRYIVSGYDDTAQEFVADAVVGGGLVAAAGWVAFATRRRHGRRRTDASA